MVRAIAPSSISERWKTTTVYFRKRREDPDTVGIDRRWWYV